jgi:hypothetical protein
MSDDLNFDALNEDEDDEIVTDASVRTHEMQTDASLPHADEAVYEDDGRSADEVDPRKLFAAPTIDEVRWYARFSGVASTIIEKPIDDAFKNGVDLQPANDDVDEDDLDDLREQFEQWLPLYKEAQKKARRDGPAAIFYKLRDGTELNESPDNVDALLGMEVMTLDKWDDGGIKSTVREGTDEDDLQNIEIRDSGLVIRRNIAVPEHRELLGYVYQENDSQHSAQFINADRAQHFAWNTKNDGDVDQFTVSEHEGDSVLLPIFIPLKSLVKTQWAMGQTVFRYSAPLYAVQTPERYGEDEFEAVNDQIEGLNSASDITLPPGCELESHGSATSLDPEPYHDKLIEDCCAGTEFTKSVLMGTQTGTVSGSSTDIKNYFNEVQKTRHGLHRASIEWFIDTLNEWGLTSLSSDDIVIEWGPLFRIDTLDRMEALVRLTTAASQAVNNYLLEPNEVRDILAAEWADLDIDIDDEGMGDLDEEDYALISSLFGDNPSGEEPDGNPRVGQNGGGQEVGNTTDPNDPSGGEL